MDNNYDYIESYFINELEKELIGHKIEGGKNQIILTAPHSVSQIREGLSKKGEFRTGLIVKELKRLTDCHIAYKTRNNNDDANYDKECLFKKELISYIKTNNIKLLLDFHISSPEREFEIDIGTGHLRNIQERDDILLCLYKQLNNLYNDVRMDDTFTAANPYTVSAFLSRALCIPSIQIEINWKIISDYKMTSFFIANFVRIIKSLEDII